MWDRIGYIFAAKAIQGFVQELMAHDKKSDEPQESNSLTEEERKLVFKKLSELENSVSGTHSYGFSVSRDRSMFMSEVGDSNPQPKEVAIVFDTCFLMQKKGEGRSGKRLWWEHTEEFHKPFEWIQELFPNVVLRLIVPVEVQEEIAKHLNSEDAELSHLARIARGRIIDLKQHEHYEEPSLQDVPAHKSKSVIG